MNGNVMILFKLYFRVLFGEIDCEIGCDVRMRIYEMRNEDECQKGI